MTAGAEEAVPSSIWPDPTTSARGLVHRRDRTAGGSEQGMEHYMPEADASGVVPYWGKRTFAPRLFRTLLHRALERLERGRDPLTSAADDGRILVRLSQ